MSAGQRWGLLAALWLVCAALAFRLIASAVGDLVRPEQPPATIPTVLVPDTGDRIGVRPDLPWPT